MLSPFFEDEQQHILFSSIDGLCTFAPNKDRFELDYISMDSIPIKGAYYLMNIDKKNKNIWIRETFTRVVEPYYKQWAATIGLS